MYLVAAPYDIFGPFGRKYRNTALKRDAYLAALVKDVL